MAVYGDMLAFFTEQFRSVSYFSMKQEVGAGYKDRTDLGKVIGVFQYMKKGDLARENEVLSDEQVPTFWTRKKLESGNFIEMKGDDCLYRITNNQPWKFEGNFYVYILESVTGNTDKQEPFTEEEVDLGVGFN